MPCSQPAISGDFGISGEAPAAPSRTISAAAATSSSAHSVASAGAHRCERTCGKAALALNGDAHEAARRAHNAVHTVFVSR